MTPTLLFWFKLGAIALMAYTVFTIVKPMVVRKYIVPKNRKEWGSLFSDLFALAAGIFLLFILQKNYSAPMEAVMQYKGKTLPSFRFSNVQNGKEESLEGYAENVVILNIWATWCPPCRREMPELDRLQKEYPGKLRVVAVSDEGTEKVAEFSKDHPYSYPLAAFTNSNELINSINTRPVSILVVNGKVEDIVVGGRGYSFFKDWVLPYVE